MKTKTPFIIGGIIGGLLLIGALPLPYPYYRFLKVAVIVACVCLSVNAYQRDRPAFMIPLGVIALFFFAMKGLSKEVWAFIDVVAAVVLVSIGTTLSSKEIVHT